VGSCAQVIRSDAGWHGGWRASARKSVTARQGNGREAIRE